MTEIDDAVVNRLKNDATLQGLAPGGVWIDIADPAATRPYVIVSVGEGPDVAQFRGSAFEKRFYAVTAEDFSESATAVKSAAKRISALLHDATFSITGYTLLKCHRDRYIRHARDDGDRRWQVAGAVFEVWAQATA